MGVWEEDPWVLGVLVLICVLAMTMTITFAVMSFEMWMCELLVVFDI